MNHTISQRNVYSGSEQSSSSPNPNAKRYGSHGTPDGFFAPAYHEMIKDKRISHAAFRLWCVLHMLRWNKLPPTMERLQTEMAGNGSAQTIAELAEADYTCADSPRRSKKRRKVERTKPATRRSIELWLGELEQAGYLTWNRGAEHSTRYHLHTPRSSDSDRILNQIQTLFVTGRASLEAIIDLLGMAPNAPNANPPGASFTPPDPTNPGTQGVPPRAHDANLDSHDANLDSHRARADGVLMREKARPNKKKESIIRKESSSCDAQKFDDDDPPFQAKSAGARSALTHTASSLFLAERGISAALEFRDLPLYIVECAWHDVMGRGDGATPGAVVVTLRAIKAALAAGRPSPYENYTWFNPKNVAEETACDEEKLAEELAEELTEPEFDEEQEELADLEEALTELQRAEMEAELAALISVEHDVECDEALGEELLATGGAEMSAENPNEEAIAGAAAQLGEVVAEVAAEVVAQSAAAAAVEIQDQPVANGPTQRRNQLWQDVLLKVQAKIPSADFNSRLANTTLLSLDGDMATICVATPYQKGIVENNYRSSIRRAFVELLGWPVQIRVVSASSEVGDPWAQDNELPPQAWIDWWVRGNGRL